MTRTDLINVLIASNGFTSYLEIGCQNNVNFDKVKCDVKISVDPDLKAGATYPVTSDDFFNGLKGSPVEIIRKEGLSEEELKLFREQIKQAFSNKKFAVLVPISGEYVSQINPEIVFIDGLHHADQVERDIINSMACLSPGGIIVLHDCNPPTEKDQLVPRRHKVWYGDVWRAFVGFRQKYPNVKSYCIDHDCGCGVIHYTDQKIESGFITDMPWQEFDTNRKTLLGIL